jgi:cytochrome c-type biogenesis protein CcsB
MKTNRYFLITLLGGLLSVLTAAGNEPLQLTAWGKMAVQDHGRRKPVDSFGREMLVRLYGKPILREGNQSWQGREFALSLLFRSKEWSKTPLILVGYRPLIAEWGLDSSRKHFSYEELSSRPHWQAKLAELRAKRQAGGTLSRAEIETENVAQRLALFVSLWNGNAFTWIPPPTGTEGVWLSQSTLAGAYGEAARASLAAPLEKLAVAYTNADGAVAERAAEELTAQLRALNPAAYPPAWRLELEYALNTLEPMVWAKWCYALAFLLVMLPVAASAQDRWARAAFIVAAVGLAWQTGGIVARCILAGRPPVTNMYESIIWAAWGTVLFCLIFFLKHRSVLYLRAGLPVAFFAMLLVQQLPLEMPDRLDPLVPVLRDNFWLTVHVLSITLSYAAFALAMGFGHLVLWRYLRDPKAGQSQPELIFWLYRILQLGVLLLAIGTILGGVWANYSWGRFWGWDPKETWALIALLCYIAAIHGRLAGWWSEFGLAVASVVCFAAVVMAWYGVNFILGAGLHSYGFGLGGEGYVITLVVADLLFVGAAILRVRTARRVQSS